MNDLTLPQFLTEYTAAQAYTMGLLDGLEAAQVFWRPDEASSSIAWHLGHQAAVNHYLVRNLTAAEVTFNADFDRVFDSATPEAERGSLPPLDEIVGYRDAVAASTSTVVQRIAAGDVGAPAQLSLIAQGLMRGVINHEYQHAKWISEVRATLLGESNSNDAEPIPSSGSLMSGSLMSGSLVSERLRQVDGYWMLEL